MQQEFDGFLKCGHLEHGFLRARCDTCHAEHLVAFGGKRRGFCPSCGARRMAQSAALLVDEVFPEQPVRSLLCEMAGGLIGLTLIAWFMLRELRKTRRVRAQP